MSLEQEEVLDGGVMQGSEFELEMQHFLRAGSRTLDTCKLDYGSRVGILKINVPKPQHKDRRRVST